MELADQLVKTLKEYRRLSKSYFGESERAESARFAKREALDPLLESLLTDPQAKRAIVFLRLADRLDEVDMFLLSAYYEED